MSYFIFLNDKIVEGTDSHLSTVDRGFLYGDGLFETIRTYNKKPFRLEDHVVRLSNSARFLEIPFNYTLQQISEILEELLIKNDLNNAYVRMTLSRGAEVNGFFPAEKCAPTFIVYTRPVVSYPLLLYETGMLLITSSIRRSTTCPISKHKTLNYLTNYIIKKEAMKRAAHDAIILNTSDYVTECTVSNIFIVEGRTVLTPSINACILPGITRKVVLELCKARDISVSEELFNLKKVLGADEVFITNSIMEIMPVSRIDGKPIGKSIPGTITKLLQNEYKALTHFQ